MEALALALADHLDAEPIPPSLSPLIRPLRHESFCTLGRHKFSTHKPRRRAQALRLGPGGSGAETQARRLRRGGAGAATQARRLMRGTLGAAAHARHIRRGGSNAAVQARKVRRSGSQARQLRRGGGRFSMREEVAARLSEAPWPLCAIMWLLTTWTGWS